METGHHLMTLHYKQNKIDSLEGLQENLKLSIQLSLDGFSFCLTDTLQNTIVAIIEHNYEKPFANHQELLTSVQSILSKEPLLNKPFEKVIILHSNNLSTFVPTPLFDKEKAVDYLKYNIKTLENDYIANDTIQTANITTVYVPFVNVNNYFFDIFGAFDYKHIATLLVESLLDISKHKELQFYVHFQKQDFQIIVIKDNKLVFYNSFSFATKEDVIYYILFTAEQLQLNPEVFKLVLLGDIEENSEIYNKIYTYVRYVSFVETEYKMHNHLEKIAPHQLFTLRKL